MHSAMLMFFTQGALVVCIHIYMSGDGFLIIFFRFAPDGSREPGYDTFALFLAKFLATIAMHLTILPSFRNGMAIMKYVNNHESRFDFPKSAYLMGLTQTLFAFVFTGYNTLILFTRVNVYFSMISYVTVSILVDMSGFYYQALSDDQNNKLFEMFAEDNMPRIKNFNRDMSFSDRTCCNKICRFLFKLIRVIYVGWIFYFVPFLFMLLHQIILCLINYDPELTV